MKRTLKSTLALIIAIILCVTNMAAVVSLADTTQSECTIEGVKIWEDNNDEKGLRPESITVDLYKDNHKVASTTASANSGWKFSFNVDSYLDANGEPINYTVKEQPVENYEQTALVNPVVTKAITIESFGKYTPNNKLTISVNKAMIVIKKGNDWTVWTERALSADEQAAAIPQIKEAGNINGNASIEFYTGDIGNGITIDTENDTITFSKKSQWSWLYAGEISFARISVASITNTLSETESPVVLKNDNNTEIKEPETINVEGRKTWNDDNDRDGKRPESIIINLLADGEAVAEVEVTEADGWAWKFENVLKYNEDGTEIVYTITENEVADYEAVVEGFNVTNTHEIETIDIDVNKVWEDDNDRDGKRPESIIINLFADGEAVAEAEVTADSNWSWTFEDMPKYRDQGTEIVYTITENEVADYEAAVDGFNVTNTHEIETIDIDVNKVWEDDDDRDGKRPESIIINLFADGEAVAEAEVTADTDWSWTFEDMPKYRDQGTEIVYTITENAVANYTTAVEGFTVTNTVIPVEKTSIVLEGVKYLDGAVSGGFSFQLTDAEGNVIGNAESTTDGSFAFETIVFDKAGNYTYTVTEIVGDDEEIIYDNAVYTVYVTVTEADNALSAEVSVAKNGESYNDSIAFYNETEEPEEIIEIEEEETPRNDDTTEIIDEDVPLTGDDNNAIYLPIMLLSVAMFGVTAFFSCKKAK